ncbi:four helix bundle protein [Gemmatimonas sp.]
MSDSRNLRVLSAAEDFAAAVLVAVRFVNAARAPGVRGQLVRSATAVPANIAEAAHLGTDPNFRRQLRLALASASESTSHLRLLIRAGAIHPKRGTHCLGKAAVVCRMLTNLIRAIDEREAHTMERLRSPDAAP